MLPASLSNVQAEDTIPLFAGSRAGGDRAAST